jgi:hypothetical protein
MEAAGDKVQTAVGGRRSMVDGRMAFDNVDAE